jgi:hypothetical protein
MSRADVIEEARKNQKNGSSGGRSATSSAGYGGQSVVSGGNTNTASAGYSQANYTPPPTTLSATQGAGYSQAGGMPSTTLSETQAAGYSQAGGPLTDATGTPIGQSNPLQPQTDLSQSMTNQLNESLDYRDLLSSQIMAEQARANASKYIMGGLQSSGLGQTGVSQSILSGIQSGYQNTLAQNVNQYNMTRDARMAGQEPQTEQELSQSQQRAMDTATTLLSEPNLTQDELSYIYDNYYSQLSTEDQKTFDFLVNRTSNETGLLNPGAEEGGETTATPGLPGISPNDNSTLFENFGIADPQTASANPIQNWDGSSQFDITVGDSTIPFKVEPNGDFANLLKVSKNWKDDKNGYIVEVKGLSNRKDYYVFFKGRWMKADPRNIDENKVSKKFKGRFGKIVAD